MGRRILIIAAVIVILLGILSLLRAVGVITFSIWSLIGAVVLICLGVAILWFIIARPEYPELEFEPAAIPLQGATTAVVRVSHGAGRLVVDGSAEAGDLVTGSFAGGLDAQRTREGDELRVAMRPKSGLFPGAAMPWRWSQGHGLDWQFGLSREVQLSLRLDMGANEARIDLSDVKATDVSLSTGVSSTELTLPAEAGHTRLRVGSGAASITIKVPEGVAARIRVSGGLSSASVDRSRFPRSEGVYQSPDYVEAANRADISIDMGVGSVSVS